MAGKSKRDKPARKRYHLENHREANKERRKAKQGAPNNGSVWKAVKVARHNRRVQARPKS